MTLVYPPLLEDSNPALSCGMKELGRVLTVLGGVIAIVGLALWSGFGAGWLGRLPGDIRIERGNSAFYFPVVTCIIVSIVLTLLMSLFRR
jgi:Protein of unknown function (DUF2905)